MEKNEARKNGQARVVFQAGVEVAAHDNPGIAIAAIVEQDNLNAASVLRKLGGQYIGAKISRRLSNGNPTRVTFYGMKNVEPTGR